VNGMAIPRPFDGPSNAYTTTKREEATVLPQDNNRSLVPPAGANGTAKDDSFAKHSFPPDGLVALSRVAYQQTPLSTRKSGTASSSSTEPAET
jgi:hypothetical protein